MIQVSGYFYDATTQQRIGSAGNYTIACMAGYTYNIAEALVNLQILEEFTDIQHWAATQYLLNSQSGSVGLNYSANLPDIGLGPIQVPISGTYTADSFSYDYNNVLYWLKIYYEGILTRSGETHDIRFCRSDNPNEMYLEYNYYKYPNGLVLCTNENDAEYINYIKTFPQSESQAAGYAPNAFLFIFNTNVSDVNPDSGAEFYIGCFNMDNAENIGSVYKGLFTDINEVTIQNQDSLVEGDAGTLFAHTLTGRSQPPTLNRNYYKKYAGTGIFINYKKPNYIGFMGIEPNIGGSTTQSYSSDYYFVGDDASGSAVAYTRTYENHTFNCFEGGGWFINDFRYYEVTTDIPYIEIPASADSPIECIKAAGISITILPASSRDDVFKYLSYIIVPESEVSPTDIPPADEPTDPSQPDIQDPYYDPTSDPESPQYDPTKDPKSPSYDPSTPHTPYRPISQPEYHEPPVQPPQDDIPLPPTPPSYITNNKMFTLYNPSGGDLNNVATFLWSSGWSVDAFKKIFANPIQCILGLMVLPQLPAAVSTKELTFGNIPSGINLHYFDSQFFDFDCGSFTIKEYYASYLDYAPYTKVSIFLPFIGDHELNTDEVMNKTVTVKYRFDLATGDCVAFIFVDSSIYYQFSGNCAARLPIGGSSSNALSSLFSLFSMAASVPAGLPALGAASAIAVTSMKQKISHSGSISGSAGLMGVMTPYLIVTRPRQAYPMNQNIFTGYPAFITESLSQLSGYTEVEQVHLEHIPATGEELVELERLLKEGVLF